MFVIRKKFRFEAAHVLRDSWSQKCRQIHGHSYILEVFFQGDVLEEYGMLVDFGLIKERIKPLIDLWDHKLIIMEGQAQLSELYTVDICRVPFNPTAENMAKWLACRIKTMFHREVKVRLHETESGYAEYSTQGWQPC